jgi:sterol desaturase/sphingolipid hydroxylase (fatty acid hydroxylase superfamily)
MYQHPLDFLLATATPMAWCVVLPVHEVAWFGALLVANYINLAGHCGHEVTRLLPGIVSPNGWAAMLDPQRRGIARAFNAVTHHELHHARFRCNYALYFTHWDRWMGTLAGDTDDVYRRVSMHPAASPHLITPPVDTSR